MMYASNGLIVAVVMLCLVVPVGAGFLMPNNESIEVWETNIEPWDLTPQVTVTDIPNTSPYGGVNNNLFLIREQDSMYVTWGNVRTETSTVYAAYDEVYDFWDTTNHIPDGTYTTTAATLLANTGWLDVWDLLVISCGGDFEITYDGQTYNQLIAFSNGRTQAYNLTTHDMADISGKTIGVYKNGTCVVECLDSSGVDHPYIDIAYGFSYDDDQYMSERAVWSNGYINHSIRMIVKVDAGTNFIIEFEDQDLKVALGLVGNSIRAGYQQGLSPSVGDTLGSREVYQYVMLYIDADENIVQFTGLMGMNNFTDSYVDKMGNTLIWDTPVEPFNNMTFAQGQMSYYVTSTTYENGTVKAIKDATVTPGKYQTSSEWQLVIGNPTVFGDTLSLGSTSYDVVRGYVTLPLYNETTQSFEDKKVAIRDMKITRLHQNSFETYINGELLDPDVGINVSNVTFGGVWLTSVYLYEVKWTHNTNYFWEEGGFNLDLSGYCVVGMVVSALCFIAAALMRSPGWADEIAMGLAVVFGVIYFAVMITG